MTKQFVLANLLLSSCFVFSQSPTEKIRLNQLGFYPSSEKVVIVEDSSSQNNFCILRNGLQKDTVFKGKLSKPQTWEYSDEKVMKAVFSDFIDKGEYILNVQGLGNSYPFSIGNKKIGEASKASMKAFYLDRASIEIQSKYGGKWSRKAGHLDAEILVHNSAASPGRPTGTIISSPNGWYDAGDYNKYIVNSGITMYSLLSLLEDFPYYSDSLNLNIPESGNKLPDILDEILWNLRWMLTMQDPFDGGVYHKLTNANFDGSIMPEFANKTRYVVKKGTAASLDFAAIMAKSSRVIAKYRKQLPGLSDSCLKASLKAYKWAKKNPAVAYVQSDLSDPSINTGAYDDFNFTDEFFWAATELFISTNKLEYIEDADLEAVYQRPFSLPVWQNVGTLGIFTLAKNANIFSGGIKYEDYNFAGASKIILNYANRLRSHKKESAYGISMGTETGDFSWGSNSVCANQGMLLIQAFLLTGDKSYLESANANLDYILGRNAVGYSFLTGFGSLSAINPHQRLSEADNTSEPLPGFMVGGPNPGQEDKGFCIGKYTSSLPAKSYTDNKCSYASNEIAINWQSGFAYLSNAIHAIRIGNYSLINPP